MFPLALLLSCAAVQATITVQDPSDTINPANWAADNARKANYSVPFVAYQFIPTVGPYYYNGTDTVITQQTLSVHKNDTSVVVITDGADVAIEYSTITKFGYASNLLQSSFYGT